MTIVARTIAATPAKTASEVWTVVVELIAAQSPEAAAELSRISGFAASIIADEVPAKSPIVVAGCGPRLRIYCAYGTPAIQGEDCDETSLSWNPTNPGWSLYLPCEKEDLNWLQSALKTRASHIFAYDASGAVPDEAPDNARSTNTSNLSVNLGGFLKK